MRSPLGLNVATRIMIPVDIAFDGALGLTWALQDKSRGSLAIGAIRNHGWTTEAVGSLLVLLACVVLIGYLSGSTPLVAIGVAACALFFLILAGLLWGAGPHDSVTAPLWPLYVAAAHLASFTYLGYEYDRGGG